MTAELEMSLTDKLLESRRSPETLLARIVELKDRNKVLEDACEILRKQNIRMFRQIFSDGKPKQEESDITDETIPEKFDENVAELTKAMSERFKDEDPEEFFRNLRE